MRLQVWATVLPLLCSYEVNAKNEPNVIAYYHSKSCGTTPNRVDLQFQGTCVAQCLRDLDGDWKASNTFCPNGDYKKAVWDAFGGASYLVQESYSSGCNSRLGASAFLASGNCEQVIMFVENWGYAVYSIAQLESDGSASVKYFTDSSCIKSLPIERELIPTIYVRDTIIDKATLNSDSCDGDDFRWSYYSLSSPFTSGTSPGTHATSDCDIPGHDTNDSNSNAKDNRSTEVMPVESIASSSRINLKVIGGSIVGVLVAVIAGLVFVLHRRRQNGSGIPESRSEGQPRSAYLTHASPATFEQETTSLSFESLNNVESLGQSGLWNDDVITAKRIQRRDIRIQHLLSRGGYGEVYAGVYNDKRVAIKMLSPETRGIMNHVNNFLAEAKLIASMDHPRIVHLIGVAWDSLSDLCVVMEYMEGGDLRTLLAGYRSSNHPVGIDREKATIALHVCHALTYLHSLSPPVIHRDLKSNNILLNHAMEAKVIDFGISRERVDQTMTAGVGTSLWMAPEVMLGEKYDDKADMFSFGVVLSELDNHTLPYANAKENNRDTNGRRMPDAIILQQVAMGRLSVSFSALNPASILELGKACVSVDPSLRPSAAEALYKMQLALRQDIVN
ncbi:unnamed protein product [Phytophthora fragariaefolia]|uniref:Unnamed protein product n=1 Tax=Phytophthora fragariaefolia TaxID=1490495 RepID=A0A9W6U4M0_9STRA|nr:unnamed protein product [Phytophthora fragariaefolia]